MFSVLYKTMPCRWCLGTINSPSDSQGQNSPLQSRTLSANGDKPWEALPEQRNHDLLLKRLKPLSQVWSISTLLSSIHSPINSVFFKGNQRIQGINQLQSSVLADEVHKDDHYGFRKRLWSFLPLWRKQHSSEYCCLNKPLGFLDRKCWSRNQASVFEYHCG